MLKQLLLFFCLLPLVVSAADDTEGSAVEWKGEGELGFTSISGNSDSESLNASLALSRQIERWKHAVSLELIKSEADNTTSADSLVFRERSEYSLGERSYAFGQLRYEDDEFSGYDYQASISVGAGKRFVESGQHLFDASAGVGYRGIKDSTTGDSDEEAIIVADAIYEYKISQTATFAQSLAVESGDENTYSESNSALKTKINGNLAAKVSYLVKHNSDVPPGIDKTDEIFTVSLVYGF